MQSVSAHGGNTHFSYDANNNLEQQTDADNRVTLQGFDAFDRLIALTDALQGQTQFAYNKQDLPTQVTDAKGLTTHYSYNGFGDTTVATSPDTGTTTYTYDSAGNRTTQTDARGVTVNFSFDALNRVKTASYPESRENISYHYDQGSFAVGKLTKITDQSGSTEYSYDARGNKVAVTYTIAGQRYTTTYRYNSADRLTGMTYPDGWEIDYSYDTSGRISQVQSARDGNTETLATTIQRLPFGPVTAMTLGNGINRTRSYDLDYRVQNINDGSVLSRNYGYSAVDNITAITNSITPALSQLFSYDNLDRLNFATGDYGDKSYRYDSVGNRLALTTDSGANSQTQSYHYNTDSHRLDSITGERGFQYDAAGNTTDNALASFTYNDRNRMASSTVNAATTTYQHNALGQRVRKTGSSGETHFIFDLDGKLIAEAEGSGVISVEYAYLDGEPLAMWRADETPTIPGVITPIAPLGSITIASPAYQWQAVGNANDYRLRIYDRALNSWVHDTTYAATDICGNGTCSVTPTGLTLNFSKNHVWRVRAKNSVGWNDWTDSLFFDYVDTIPGVITPTAPLGSISTATPAYEWQDLGNASDYRLRIYDRALNIWVHDETYPAVDICSNNICSVTPTDLTLNFSKNHVWRLRAKNSAGWNDWSDSLFFDYVDSIPGVITTIAPLGTISTATPAYEWQDLGNATDYRLRVYDRALTTWVHDATYPIADICNVGTCSVTLADLTLNVSNNHLWRIRAKNSAGWNGWSDYQRFDVIGGQ